MPITVSSATDTAENASSDSDPVYLANPQIPVDLFVSKKHPGLPRGILGFAVASGCIVFRVQRDSTKSSCSNNKKLVLDSNGSPVLSIHHFDDGLWKCYKVEEGNEEKELLFRVKRSSKALTKVELEVFLGDESLRDDSTCDMKIMGFPYQKSCTMYKANHVVAQTSLMYKLHQIYVKRSKFRLTIFPGSADLSLIVALTYLKRKNIKITGKMVSIRIVLEIWAQEAYEAASNKDQASKQFEMGKVFHDGNLDS